MFDASTGGFYSLPPILPEVKTVRRAMECLLLGRPITGVRGQYASCIIMDHRTVVGVGNIYASEALFRARIHPATPAAALDPPRLAVLAEEIKKVLRAAIDQGGTTISDYRGSGAGGRFQQRLYVYGRQGEDCRVCDSPVESFYLGGRNTFYCPSCQ